MTAPAAKLSITDRYKLKELDWQRSQVVQPGKVMWCRGRKVLGYGKVEDLSRVTLIPSKADTVCLSAVDYADVMVWLAWEGAA